MPITFQVNLQVLENLSAFQPYDAAFASNFPSTFSTWFPNINIDNVQKVNGQQFTVSGQDALYYLKTYTTPSSIPNGILSGYTMPSSLVPYCFLNYVSGTLP